MSDRREVGFASPEPQDREEQASFNELAEILEQSNGYAGKIIQHITPMEKASQTIGIILPLSETDNTRCLVHFIGDSTTLPITYVVGQKNNSFFNPQNPSVTDPSTSVEQIEYGPRRTAFSRLKDFNDITVVWSSVNPEHRSHIINATTNALELAEQRLKASFAARTAIGTQLLTEATPIVREIRRRFFPSPQTGR